MTLVEQMTALARDAKAAARALARLSPADKNKILAALAAALERNSPLLLEANQVDLATASGMGLSAAMIDRLRLNEKRIAAMAHGLREIAALPDPVGRLLDERTRPNGLKLRKISTPIGVIVIIFESRPNVTADAAGLCLKSGNASILRGGKEALQSNLAIARVMLDAARDAAPAFPAAAIQVVPTPDREAIPVLLSLTSYIDLCMPRGGEGLIRAVAECSKVPVIKHYKGVCHAYVDAEADLEMAARIVLNGKVQRPAVCNSIETLLVHRAVAAPFLTALAPQLNPWKVELRADPESSAILASQLQTNASDLRLRPAAAVDWSTEYNDYVLNVKVVADLGQAIDHINEFGSNHSDTIVTRHPGHAQQFLDQVDSAAVYWNASTRFTDGGEFGMGAEIGISTDKIGARGPMGLEELTSYKWIGIGEGQVRA